MCPVRKHVAFAWWERGLIQSTALSRSKKCLAPRHLRSGAPEGALCRLPAASSALGRSRAVSAGSRHGQRPPGLAAGGWTPLRWQPGRPADGTFRVSWRFVRARCWRRPSALFVPVPKCWSSTARAGTTPGVPGWPCISGRSSTCRRWGSPSGPCWPQGIFPARQGGPLLPCDSTASWLRSGCGAETVSGPLWCMRAGGQAPKWPSRSSSSSSPGSEHPNRCASPVISRAWQGPRPRADRGEHEVGIQGSTPSLGIGGDRRPTQSALRVGLPVTGPRRLDEGEAPSVRAGGHCGSRFSSERQ